MLCDFHIHTNFSTDSESPMRAQADRAIALGIPVICITDHHDPDFPEGIMDDPDAFQLSMEPYLAEVQKLKNEYKGRLEIRTGVELGLQPHLTQLIPDFLNTYRDRLDYVIGSTHLVRRMDPYYPSYFEGRTEKEAYLEYFETCLKNVQLFDGYQSLGHLDFVLRYGPNKNHFFTYDAYRDVLDAILETLVKKNIALECNSAGLAKGLGVPNPAPEVIRRFRELGGEMVICGSDAHAPEYLGYDFDKLPALLKDCGFRYYTIFKNHKPEFLPL